MGSIVRQTRDDVAVGKAENAGTVSQLADHGGGLFSFSGGKIVCDASPAVHCPIGPVVGAVRGGRGVVGIEYQARPGLNFMQHSNWVNAEVIRGNLRLVIILRGQQVLDSYDSDIVIPLWLLSGLSAMSAAMATRPPSRNKKTNC